MPYATGIALAFLTALLARAVGLDRDRALYPSLLMVIASYYVLFAVMGESTHAVLIESVVTIAFVLLAVTGFRLSLWVVVAMLAGHGAFDLVHPLLITNAGVPVWWPAFCLAFDVTLALCVAGLLWRGTIPARRPEPTSTITPPR